MTFTYKKIAVAFFFVCCLSAPGIPSSFSAITAEGNYCWNIKITEDKNGAITPETYVMKTHIVPLGNKTTAIIRGSVVVNDDYSPIITGVASISSTSINATLNATQRHKNNNWNDTSSLQMVINQSTLKGTFFEIGHDFDRSSHTFDDRYSRGQLIPIKCP